MMYAEPKTNGPNLGQADRPMSELEQSLHQTTSSLTSAENRLYQIIAHVAGPAPIGLNKDEEPVPGLTSHASRNSNQAARVYEMIERLGNLL